MAKVRFRALIILITLIITQVDACHLASAQTVDERRSQLILDLPFDDPEGYKFASEGVVQNETTAIKLAAVVIEALYGKEALKSQLPLVAKSDGDFWKITGSAPRNWVGANVMMRIARKDGRIVWLRFRG